MTARNKLSMVLLMLVVCAQASELPKAQLTELRKMPGNERILAFRQLDQKDKINLFFLANQRHPPYTGLDDAIEREGKNFFMQLRKELDGRGGVPEVLSFMGMVLDMKNHGDLSSKEIGELRIAGICRIAERSSYCPELEKKLLAQ